MTAQFSTECTLILKVLQQKHIAIQTLTILKQKGKYIYISYLYFISFKYGAHMK